MYAFSEEIDKETNEKRTTFTAASVKAWFKGVLQELGDEKHLIMCDNARIHKQITNVCDFRYKHEAEAYLQKEGIAYNRKDDQQTLRAQANAHQRAHALTDLQQLAAAKGHKLIYAPAGVPQLEPIELFWNQLKSPIIASYSAGRTMSILKELVEGRIKELSHDHTLIDSLINHVNSQFVNKWASQIGLDVPRSDSELKADVPQENRSTSSSTSAAREPHRQPSQDVFSFFACEDAVDSSDSDEDYVDDKNGQ